MVTKSILLAEDNPAHAGLILRAIEEADPSCRADVVNNGVEALEYLFGIGSQAGQAPQQLPDLILLDMKMPEMDGLHVGPVRRTGF